MVNIQATLTNEEAFALHDILDDVESRMTKRMMGGGSPNPRDKTAASLNALRRLTRPIRAHVRAVRSANRGAVRTQNKRR